MHTHTHTHTHTHARTHTQTERERGRERERGVVHILQGEFHEGRLYGVGHMVKDHSDSERRKLLPPHRLLLKQVFFYMHHPTDRISHTLAFVTPVVDHWLE